MRIVDVKAIKVLMVECDIDTIGELADVSGVNRNTLSDVLNEKALPSAETMARLADALRMEPEQAGRIFFAQKLA